MSRRWPRQLVGREQECARIDALIAAAHAGRGDSLVFRGEPGIGKTTLLEYARRQSKSALVLYATGRQSELELPYAGLLELLRPLEGLLAEIPPPQAEALRAVFGLHECLPEHFQVFAATLSVLALAGERLPVVLLLDDVQWLDEPSLGAVLFAVRRLRDDAVGALFAVRDADGAPALEGIEMLPLTGLDGEAAATLLRRAAPDLDEVVQARLAEAAGGNPLALIELPDLLDRAQRTGLDPLPTPLRGGGAAAHIFAERIAGLPDETQLALVAAAIAETEDLAMLSAALLALELDLAALAAAERAGLVELADGRFVFRHPLARSAAYEAVSPDVRRRAHRAHAAALEGTPAHKARVRHLAFSAEAPDEELAAQLSALATAAGEDGWAASLRTLEYAARLTPDPRRRAERMLVAAEAARTAGRADSAVELAQRAIELSDDRLLTARAERVVALVEGWNRGQGGKAAERLVAAAASIEESHPGLAATMCAESVELWSAAGELDRADETMRRAWALAWPRGGATEVRIALRLADTQDVTGKFREAREMWLYAAGVFDDPLSEGDPSLLLDIAEALFCAHENEPAHALAEAGIALAREQGALGLLPCGLELLAMLEARAGRLAAAAAAASEALELARALDDGHETLHVLGTLAWIEAMQGREQVCRAHVAEGSGLLHKVGANALFDPSGLGLLELSLGRPDQAIAVFESLGPVLGPRVEGAGRPRPVLANLVEAEARGGRRQDAERDLAILEEQIAQVETPAAAAAAGRCRGLLVPDTDLDPVFGEALEWHERAGNPFEEARARLCYGERLRRAKRRADAREELRAALRTFDELGADLWARRAATELAATGERARRREPSAAAELTPQELVVARLVAQGLTNREVAAQLFLSTNTIETHLRHVFQKLDVRSRTQLAARFTDFRDSTAAPAV